MASTGSIGTLSSTSATASHDYALRFAQLVEETQTAIELAQVQDALQLYAAARAEVTAWTTSGLLTAHHRAQFEAQLSTLRDALEACRKQQRSGFTFKRKPRPPDKTIPAPTPKTLQQPTRLSNVVDDSHVQITDLKREKYTWHTEASSLELSRLRESVIDLRTAVSLRSVQIRDVQNCLLLLPAVEGSVMVHGMQRCTLISPSVHQLRMHESHTSSIQVSTKHASRITIEHCTSLTFYQLDRIQVQDFDSLADSRNYTLIPHTLSIDTLLGTLLESIV